MPRRLFGRFGREYLQQGRPVGRFREQKSDLVALFRRGNNWAALDNFVQIRGDARRYPLARQWVNGTNRCTMPRSGQVPLKHCVRCRNRGARAGSANENGKMIASRYSDFAGVYAVPARPIVSIPVIMPAIITVVAPVAIIVAVIAVQIAMITPSCRPVVITTCENSRNESHEYCRRNQGFLLRRIPHHHLSFRCAYRF